MKQKEEEILKKIEKLSEDIQENSNNDSNFNQRGNYYYELKKYDEAITDYSEAIRIDSKNATYYNNRGKVYYNLKKYDEAIADYSEAIKLEPKNSIFYNNRGKVYYELKEYEKALVDCNEAIKLNPKNSVFYNNRGNIYYELKEYEKALPDYNEAIKLNSKNPILYSWRGDFYYELEEYEKALADYSEAVKFDPENASFYNRRGNVYHKLKEYEKALADYSEAIKFDPENASFYNRRGNLYYELKEYERALVDYTEAIRLAPKNIVLNTIFYSNRGNTYYKSKEYKKALADYNEAIKLNPINASFYNQRGNTHYKLKEYEKALADYNEAIKLNPNFQEAIVNRDNIVKKDGVSLEDNKNNNEFDFDTSYANYLITSFDEDEKEMMDSIRKQFDNRVKELEEKKNLTQQEEEEKSKCKKYSKLIKLGIKEIKGLLTFADILGWKGIWQKDDIENSIEKLINIKKFLENEIDSKCIHINLISDTFVISVNEVILKKEQGSNLKNKENIFKLSNCLCKKLIEHCLKQGLLIRGATAYGECYTKEMVYIGKSVDEAASWHEKAEEVGIFYTPSARLRLLKEYSNLKEEKLKKEIKKVNLKKGEILGKSSEKIKTMDTFFINWHENNEEYFYKIMESEIIHPEISQKYFNTEKKFKK